MSRQNTERQNELEPQRIEYAKSEITKLGFSIIYEDSRKIQFEFKGNKITLYPYSGWFTGKGIKDGRGLKKLLKQLEEIK